MADSRQLRTPPVRLSYAHLIEPRQYKENGKPKGDPTFNTELILEADALEKFELLDEEREWTNVPNLAQLLAEVAKDEWGSDLDIEGAVKHGGMKWPIIDGNAKIRKKEEGGKKASNMDQYRDRKVIRAKSSQKWPPRLHVHQGGEWKKLDRDNEDDMKEAKKLFTSGNYVVAILNLTPNEVDNRKYLTFYINDLMFYKKGDSLGGVDSATIFSGYEGGESNFDPSEGLGDDVIGL